MKHTAREALLARHAAAGPALDALRRASLPPARLSVVQFLRELFLPARYAWAALALIWLAITLIQFLPSSPATPTTRLGKQPLALCSTSNSQIDALFNETRALR